jgi:hypothetical protein
MSMEARRFADERLEEMTRLYMTTFSLLASLCPAGYLITADLPHRPVPAGTPAVSDQRVSPAEGRVG